jgi:DNA-binding response OmpR family regulator
VQSVTSVLIVDDEEDIANILRQFLTQAGFNAVSFTSPLLALEHFMHNPLAYPVIITDLRMPGMSGIELANKIREINTAAKIS